MSTSTPEGFDENTEVLPMEDLFKFPTAEYLRLFTMCQTPDHLSLVQAIQQPRPLTSLHNVLERKSILVVLTGDEEGDWEHCKAYHFIRKELGTSNTEFELHSATEALGHDDWDEKSFQFAKDLLVSSG